jgi:hypothetical protein
MKYDLDIRSRTTEAVSINDRHSKLMGEWSRIASPWGIPPEKTPAAPDPGADIGAGVSLTRVLGKVKRVQVYYCFRWSGLRDEGCCDDFIDMAFNPLKVDYAGFVREVLPRLILAFDAYLAELGDNEFVHIDFDRSRREAPDCRSDVYRVWPVSFYDELLCRRAFALKPAAIADRLKGVAEHVELLGDGVYIVGSSRPLPLSEADELCKRLKSAILG